MPQLIIFILLAVPFVWAKPTYTLADLEVLANEGSTSEFFDHALDIRPSERQEAWKSMVIKMADAYSRKISNKVEIERQDYLFTEKLFGWPVLQTDDIFRTRRHSIGMRFLKACFKKEKDCWKDVKEFWEKDQKDPDTSFKLAELTLEYQDGPLSTWSFLEVALKSPLSEFYCKKPFVMASVWGKIEIDYIKLGPEGDLLKKIDQTIHPDCLPSFIKEAQSRLHRPPKVLDRELSFQILKSLGKETQELSDFFFTVYLLDNPSQGELFNYSWNRVRELGGTISRREKVLSRLKALDPLPDEIFASIDQTKKRVVLQHFKTYFPEYLDHYADQCIEFYGGKGSFPNGNPSIHCQEFMSSELAPKLIDDFKIKKYQSVRQI